MAKNYANLPEQHFYYRELLDFLLAKTNRTLHDNRILFLLIVPLRRGEFDGATIEENQIVV